MSKFDKLIHKIKSLDNNMRFDEIRKILEMYGYTMSSSRSGSSHRTFRKENSMPITIPIHEQIKRVYIVMLKELIEREEYNNEDT